jgi:hypothetical protein
MIEHIILAMRASPDWAQLARDHAAGQEIDPSRYMPANNPRFPLDIPQVIARWNKFSRVSFFACRQRLREIAAENLATIEGATLTPWAGVPALLDRLAGTRALLFYHDDDDWFAPALARLVGELDVDGVDAVVFPFPRLAANLVTFTRGGAPTRDAVGRCEPFRYRYCTNNYGLTPRALATGPLALVEHEDASERAEALGFVDVQVDTIVSATSKTPCSAGWLRTLADEEAAFRRYVGSYLAALEALELANGVEWLGAPLRKTIELFASVGA